MCLTCGCGRPDDVHVHDHSHDHDHDHDHEHEHDHGGQHHSHAHDHAHAHGHDHEHGHDHHHDHDHVIEPLDQGTQKRLVKMEHDLLAANDQHAREVRELMAAKKVLCLNLVSSPGAGKTTLLVETIKALGDRFPLAVIEGDQQTARDADRIRETGAHAIQINTGKGCHLEAWTIRRALEQLTLQEGSVLFVENVGNLVCPAEFDLGEAHKVAILSTAEGDDKPIKYPHMFAASDLMIVNKSDLLPYVDFDVERCIEFARRVNPHIEVITLSAKTGEGLDTWLEWVDSRRV